MAKNNKIHQSNNISIINVPHYEFEKILEDAIKEANIKLFKNEIEENGLKNILQQRYHSLISYTHSNQEDIKNDITHYFSICKNINIDFASDITHNKCIIDPLGNPISDIKNISIEVSEVNDWMLRELKKNPTDLYKLSSRRFEELIAEIFMRKGFNVELTPATHDGGKDIYVASKNDFGSFLYIVECKNYKPTHKVGVNVLRDLYGVLSKERATYGIAVTTSYFSKSAQEFQQELQFQMSLQDFNSIKQWLCDVI